tara:strand:+ start:519 stop:1982 length:1464 start_codon:yes stop_codon:yes gene_type:complete
MTNLAYFLDHQATRKGKHPAIIDGKNVISYRKLAEKVKEWAAFLEELGFKEGDVIAVGLGDTADHLVMNWAIIRLGAIILPIDHRWSNEEKINLINGFNSKGYVKDNENEGLFVGEILEVTLDNNFKENAKKKVLSNCFSEGWDGPMVLSLSSGTTGAPKGPALTHKQMAARWLTQLISLGFTERDRYLSATPLYFGGGRSFTLSATWCGATVVMCPQPYKLETLIKLAISEKATTLLLVPTILRRLLALKKPDALLFPNLRLLLSTGSVLHKKEREQVMRYLCSNFINYYGSTEGGGISILTSDHGTMGEGSVGQVVFNTEVEIVDSNHRPLPIGSVGKLRYRGEGVASGFYKNPEADVVGYRESWFYPGDLAYLNAEGFLFLSGREKEVIIRGAINIYPSEIEAVFLSHPEVDEAAAIGLEAFERGEEIGVFFVGSCNEQKLRVYVKERIASYKVPKLIKKIDSIPKSELGKVLTSELKKLANNL